MKTSRIAIALAATLMLAACATDQNGPKQGIGTLIGAGLGGLAGSQIGGGTGKLVAVGAGVLLGGILGNNVGRSLDKADQLYAARHAQDTLEYAPSGTTSSWVNPDSGNSGTFTPTDVSCLKVELAEVGQTAVEDRGAEGCFADDTNIP